MNVLDNLNETKTMTLKEITDLLDVRHNDAMKIVEKMIEKSSFGTATKISYQLPKGNGATQTIETYQLDYRQSMAISAKLNTELLMRVIDRWHELESQQIEPQFKLPDFTNPVESARAWADEVEAKQAALAQVESQKNTIKTKDELIKVSNEASVKAGEILIREFVKSTDLIPLGEKQFFAWMRDHKIIFSDRNEPYQHFVNAGYFTYKPSEEMIGGKFRHTLRVTPRGKVWLAAKYMYHMDAEGILATPKEHSKRNGLVLAFDSNS